METPYEGEEEGCRREAGQRTKKTWRSHGSTEKMKASGDQDCNELNRVLYSPT